MQSGQAKIRFRPPRKYTLIACFFVLISIGTMLVRRGGLSFAEETENYGHKQNKIFSKGNEK